MTTTACGRICIGGWRRTRACTKANGAVHVISGRIFDRNNDRQPDDIADTKYTKPDS